MQTFRFLEQPVENEGTDKNYHIHWNDRPQWQCALTRKRVWEQVVLSSEGKNELVMSPTTKILNNKWDIQTQDGAPAATIIVNSDGCKVLSASGDELFQIGDPRRWQEKLVETALNSWPDRYVIAVNNAEVGQIARRLGEGEPEPVTRIQKLKGLLKSRDWVAEVSEDFDINHQDLLVAALLLLIEVVVRGKRT